MVRAITEFNTTDFDGSHCFLCCEPLSDNNRSDEHIFPKWLQRKHNLWNERLTLLNGTLIPYRNLLIPCCSNCNNGPLSELEKRVQSALSKRPHEISDQDQIWIYLWAGKILFCILAKERGLLVDRSAPASGPIIPRSELDRLKAIHCHLQAVRFRHEFGGPNCKVPGSIVVLEAKDAPEAQLGFDFGDDYLAFSLFLRTGDRVIYANFDGGLVGASIGHLMREEAQGPLHPIQAKELWAKFMYKTQLVSVILFFLNKFDDQQQKLFIQIMSYDDPDNLSRMMVLKKGDTSTYIPVAAKPQTGELFREWKPKDYGLRLAALLGVEPDDVFIDRGMTKVGTFLTDSKGRFRDIPFG